MRCTKALAICGSLNPVSLRQVRYAQMHGVPSVLTPGALREVSGYVNTPEGMALLNTLREKVKTSPALLMNLSPPEASQGQQEADETGRARIVQNAGELTAKLLDAERFDLLIVFGGDTLYGIIRALQNATVTPIAELAPGVAQSALTFGEGRRCTLISKSGGLGEEDFLPEMLSRFGVPTF